VLNVSDSTLLTNLPRCNICHCHCHYPHFYVILFHKKFYTFFYNNRIPYAGDIIDLSEAYRITQEYQGKSVLEPDEEFMLIEAFSLIIHTYKDSEDVPDGYIAMFNLASHYKRRGEYDLALKYFVMCSDHGGELVADMEIGDIYYYGLAGAPDYEKAFKYYSSSANYDFPKAKLMLAEMYEKGQFVRQDHERYRELILAVYDQIQDSPVPHYKGHVFAKVAEIYLEDELPEAAFQLLLDAHYELTKQLLRYTENSDLDLMKRIIERIYELSGVDVSGMKNLHLYDLYQILKQPASVEFRSQSGTHRVSSFSESGEITIEFDGKWFRNIDEFFYNAAIDGKRLPALCLDLSDFRIL